MERAVAVAAAAAAGDMVEAVEAAPRFYARADGLFGGSGLAGVADERFAVGDFLAGFFDIIGVPAHDDDVSALFDEGLCGGEAEARCAADDHQPFTL